jgi:hypothetical protein
VTAPVIIGNAMMYLGDCRIEDAQRQGRLIA